MSALLQFDIRTPHVCVRYSFPIGSLLKCVSLCVLSLRTACESEYVIFFLVFAFFSRLSDVLSIQRVAL